MTTTLPRAVATDVAPAAPLLEPRPAPDPVTPTAHGASSPRPASRACRLRSPLLRALPFAAIALVWYVATASRWTLVVPSPAEVGAALGDLAATGELGRQLLASVARVAKGLAIGVVAGLTLGTVTGLFRTGETVLDGPLQAMRMLPSLALTPFFITWLGIHETPKIALIALGATFPVYLNTYHGIRGVDARYVEAARSFGLNRLQLIATVVLPGTLPQFFVGLRQAFSVAWLVLVVAEQIAADSGMGYLMTDARNLGRVDVIFVVLLAYALLGLLSDLSVRGLEGRFLSWRRSFTGA